MADARAVNIAPNHGGVRTLGRLSMTSTSRSVTMRSNELTKIIQDEITVGLLQNT